MVARLPRYLVAVLLLVATARRVQAKAATYTTEEATTEFSLTCYTCVNVSDNEVCNQFAIDRPCPPGKTFCHTLHAMGHVGESWLVNKKCADRTECTRANVGCTRTDGQTVCVSCCDESYCNEPVPRNNATATLKSTRNSAHHHQHPSFLLLLLALLCQHCGVPLLSLPWPPGVT